MFPSNTDDKLWIESFRCSFAYFHPAEYVRFLMLPPKSSDVDTIVWNPQLGLYTFVAPLFQQQFRSLDNNLEWGSELKKVIKNWHHFCILHPQISLHAYFCCLEEVVKILILCTFSLIRGQWPHFRGQFPLYENFVAKFVFSGHFSVCNFSGKIMEKNSITVTMSKKKHGIGRKALPDFDENCKKNPDYFRVFPTFAKVT